jgi:iron complex transport system substrate-binding protein
MTIARSLRPGLAGAALALLAACGGGSTPLDTGAPHAAGQPAPDPGGTAGRFPVTVENCGLVQTFDRPPTRAVTMNQHVTEVLLALGLEGSMAGTAYLDSAVRADLAGAHAAVPVLAERYPSREQVLAVEPDLVVGGFRSAFGDDAAGSRESLAEAGIATYLTSGYCPDRDEAQTLDLVIGDITNLGAIFGVPDRAEALVAEILAPVEATAARLEGVEPVEVFVYDSGTDQAFTAAGHENTTALLALAVARNVFDDVAAAFTEVSWEDVVARDPDAVVVLDYGDESAEDKVAFLRAHPVASTLRAVQGERFVVVELTDVVPGIRNGDAVAALADGLHGRGG